MSNFDMEQFGDKIKSIRTMYGLTQRQLAEHLEVSPTQISDIEKGKSTPSLRRAVLLAECLHISLDELTGLSGELNSISTHDDLIQKIQSLSLEKRLQVMGYVDRILEE